MILCLAMGIALVRYVTYHAQYFPDHNSFTLWSSKSRRSHKLQKSYMSQTMEYNFETSVLVWPTNKKDSFRLHFIIHIV